MERSEVYKKVSDLFRKGGSWITVHGEYVRVNTSRSGYNIAWGLYDEWFAYYWDTVKSYDGESVDEYAKRLYEHMYERVKSECIDTESDRSMLRCISGYKD